MADKKLSEKDYAEIGRAVENIYEAGYADRKKVYKMSFVKGLLAGLGGVIGATIIVALLLWVLSLFETVPLIGPLSQKVQDTVNSQPK